MRHNAYVLLGLTLLLGLGIVAASCSGPEATREERTVQRQYRIQVHMTTEKEKAERMLAQVHAWWNQLPEAQRPSSLTASGLQPEIVWRQPYYRVRVGQFATRTAAEEALTAVKKQFSDAFIAPVRVPAARR